jgi:hypothetical protein
MNQGLFMTFPCTKCGLCCQHINDVSQLIEYHSGNGICIHFDEKIGCVIYENRPQVCRIDEGYEYFFSKLISLSEYYDKNAQMCNQLQEKNEIDKRYRVILK